ncbi:MAG: DUF1080 domain-containing protein [Sediminicola sp.]|tara:strand:- start:16645 stop:17460 length:816 start_codon:yes stop_codon:yes gene_type:complete
MRNLYFLALLLLVFSCKEKVEVEPLKEKSMESDEIVHEEYTGKEPTTPEETEFYEPVPPVVDPGKSPMDPPSDAVVLFDGKNFDQWVAAKDSTEAKWTLNDDGSMTVKDRAGDIQTKDNYGSVQLHIEWKSPAEVEGEGQHRGNSGVFLQGLYEVQVLDNNDNDTYVNGQVGSIYKQHVPLVKASVPTGEWNVYDIIFHQPVFNAEGKKIKSGTLTLIHNGVLVQDHVELKGTTPYIGWPKNDAHGPGPIRLQDHGDNSRVSFRNIWLREL